MSEVKFYSQDYIHSLVNRRAGERKFGESLASVNSWEHLAQCEQQYILLGIPEDIGVRANFGTPGTSLAWNSSLRTLCNIQQNRFNDRNNIVVLGEINCDTEMRIAADITSEEPHFEKLLGDLVERIDAKVAVAIKKVVEAKKIPIIIGGGHNNSYGNLKGTSIALGTSLNCVNLDAHTDFRPLEHRHSGNGFSYASDEGYLENYFIFGMHKNYTSEAILKDIDDKNYRIKYALFEDLVQQNSSFEFMIDKAKKHVSSKPFSVEIDLDAIANMGSSASSPSGLTVEQTRFFLKEFVSHPNCCYIHICEGAPKLAAFPNQVSKTISYLVSDILSL